MTSEGHLLAEAVSRRINVVAGLTGGGGVRRAPLMESLGASSPPRDGKTCFDAPGSV